METCGVYIKENCFIEDENGEIVIIGNECINKFCKISYRSCSNCEARHQNRKDNYCNDCRIILKKQEEDIKLKEITCIEEGCTRKKNKWNGKLMPRCKLCFFKNKNSF